MSPSCDKYFCHLTRESWGYGQVEKYVNTPFEFWRYERPIHADASTPRSWTTVDQTDTVVWLTMPDTDTATLQKHSRQLLCVECYSLKRLANMLWICSQATQALNILGICGFKVERIGNLRQQTRWLSANANIAVTSKRLASCRVRASLRTRRPKYYSTGRTEARRWRRRMTRSLNTVWSAYRALVPQSPLNSNKKYFRLWPI